MWDFFTKVFPTLVDVATHSKKNTDDIKRINTRLDNLAEALNWMEALQQQAEARQEETERRHKMEMKNLMLRLENILLRHGINPNSPDTLPELNEDK